MSTTNVNIVQNEASKLPPRLLEPHIHILDLLSHRWMICFRKFFSDTVLSSREWYSLGQRVHPVLCAIYVPEEFQERNPIKVHIDTISPRSSQRRTVDVEICADFSPDHQETQKAINQIETYMRVNVFNPGYMPSPLVSGQVTTIQVPSDKREYCYAEVIFFEKLWKPHSFTIGDRKVVQDETGFLNLSDDPLAKLNRERHLLSQMQSRNGFKAENLLEVYSTVDSHQELEHWLDDRLPDADTDESYLMLNAN